MQEYNPSAMLESKMHSSERALILKPFGTGARTSAGLLDKKSLAAGDSVHIIQNPSTGLWHFKYTAGNRPEPLQQAFTSYNKIIEFGRAYFLKRGLKIEEVRDIYA